MMQTNQRKLTLSQVCTIILGAFLALFIVGWCYRTVQSFVMAKQEPSTPAASARPVTPATSTTTTESDFNIEGIDTAEDLKEYFRQEIIKSFRQVFEDP